jgi:predicted Zn finger-like uncharacterized protein
MLIVCPNCETSYQVDPSSVGSSGRSVRCLRCRTVWFAANTAALSEIAAAHRAEMAQFAASASGTDAVVALQEPPGEAAAAAEMVGESVPSAASGAEPDPEDVRVVHDAPPIATAAPDEPPTGHDTPAGSDVPVVESPTLAPIEHGATASDPGVGEDIETVAARRAQDQARNRRGRLQLPGLPTTILALIVLNLGLIGWRAEIVRIAPQTASLYAAIGLPVNLRGLVLANVTTETQTHEGVQVLLVQGRIVSTATRVVEVPRLRFAVRNERGNEIYSWTALPNRSLLTPGDTLAFQSRLASPPPETRDVLVRFFNRRDLGAGIE